MNRACRYGIAALLMCLLGIPALIGCGGGSGSTSPPPASSGGTGLNSGDASFDTRAAVTKGVSDLYGTLPHTSIDADNQAILTYLKSRSELEAAGQVEPGSVWGRFKDNGEVFVVINDGSVTAADLNRSASLGQSAAPKPTIPARRSATELPSGQNLFLFNDIGANALLSSPHPAGAVQNAALWIAAKAHVDHLKDLLADPNGANYTQVQVNSGTPATLKTVQNADGLYLYGHAGWGIDRNGRTVLVLNTAQPTIDVLSPLTLGTNDLKTYQSLIPDIVAGRVGMSMVVDGGAGDLATPDRKLTMKAYYYITPQFVRQYMSFVPNTSFVIVNGCNVADPTLGADWSAAFKEKNAAVFGSWDKHTNGFEAFDTADLLFSWISGGALGSVQLDPPQRAFPYQPVVSAMMATPRPGKGYSFAQSGGHEGTATFSMQTLTTADPTFGVLTPSIENMSVASTADNELTLTVLGTFGSVPGKVTINGTEEPAKWGPFAITLTLPSGDQPDGSGDVVVSVNGHNSNPVPLTLWTIKIHAENQSSYSGTVVYSPADTFSKEIDADLGGSSSTSGDLTVFVRADVHDYRSIPAQNPTTKPVAIFAVAQNGHKTRDAMVTSWTASGTSTADLHYPGEPVFNHLTDTLSPTGSGQVRFDGSDPRGRVASITGSVNTNSHLMTLFTGVTASSIFTDTHTDSLTKQTTMSEGGGIGFILGNGSNGTSVFNIQLGDDFSVTGGSFSDTQSDPSVGVTTQRKFSWSGTVSHAPRSDTPRNARLRH